MAKSYTIGVIAGDGIGPEVVREALRVLDVSSQIAGFSYDLVHYPWSSQHYLDTGELMPESIIDEYRKLDAILLGALGDPRLQPGLIEHNIIMGLRLGLDLYVNLRPVQCPAEHLSPLKGKGPDEIDFVVVRENTEDLYTGTPSFSKKGTPDEVVVATGIYTRKGTERVIRYAFDLARARKKQRKLTMVDKANAVRAHDLWTRTFAEVGQAYPDIEQDHAYVDAACMWMVKNPEWFDVVVTTNLFGDIITDLGAMLQGGMGLAASGNIHPGKTSMFEPIHGSAPKYAGQNVANPLGAISALAMLLDYVGEARAASLIQSAIRALLQSRRIPSLQAGALPTDEVGRMVAAEVESLAAKG
ncbi:MAG: 3-isopropylmalate dehydrogenase [Herpetosiphonaceae bacterium]|nr:MAG: 3-isopropylmalate dehydrogenase [Herpetosiphonaceae bacterium]